jgi:hypothetical protein
MDIVCTSAVSPFDSRAKFQDHNSTESGTCPHLFAPKIQILPSKIRLLRRHNAIRLNPRLRHRCGVRLNRRWCRRCAIRLSPRLYHRCGIRLSPRWCHRCGVRLYNRRWCAIRLNNLRLCAIRPNRHLCDHRRGIRVNRRWCDRRSHAKALESSVKASKAFGK